MDEKPFEKLINDAFEFLLEAGFAYEYLYDKGSDSSCVYIYRFKKGREFIDFRVVSGGNERNVVVFADGQYIFPNFNVRHKKAVRAFKFRHLLKKATNEELWRFASELVQAEIKDGKLFGIGLERKSE